jgi:hypothetical protein
MLYHHTVVITELRDVAQGLLCRKYFFLMVYHWNVYKKNHQCQQSDCLMFIHSYYVLQIHGTILSFIISVNCTVHISVKRVLSTDCAVILKVIEHQHDIVEWTSTNNVTSCTKYNLPQSIVQIWSFSFDPCYLFNICFY